MRSNSGRTAAQGLRNLHGKVEKQFYPSGLNHAEQSGFGFPSFKLPPDCHTYFTIVNLKFHPRVSPTMEYTGNQELWIFFSAAHMHSQTYHSLMEGQFR